MPQWLFGPEKISFHYWSAPRVSRARGVKKYHCFFHKWKCFPFAPKRHKLKKTIKIEEKMSKEPCFLRYFWIFFNFGVILAHQTSTGIFSRSWCIFWHTWDPWGRINSGDIWVLRFSFVYFVTVAPPGGFFTLTKMLPNVSFIIKVIKNSGFVSTNSHNFIVSRESHPLKASFWKDLNQISPVWYMMVVCLVFPNDKCLDMLRQPSSLMNKY